MNQPTLWDILGACIFGAILGAFIAFNFKGQIMVINATYTTWHAEGLDNFYGHDNGGLIYGVYVYDDDDNLIESLWFKTEKQARAALLTV